MMQRKKPKGFYKIFSQPLLTWNGIIGKMLTYLENVAFNVGDIFRVLDTVINIFVINILVTKMVDEIIFNI